MEKECELLKSCGFFVKYQSTKNLACRGFIATYCKGDKMYECKRLAYRKKNGVPPVDDMMPSGQIIAHK
jgi:hypothetical protein